MYVLKRPYVFASVGFAAPVGTPKKTCHLDDLKRVIFRAPVREL